MSEFVLVMPFLVLVLSLLFFLGRMMARVEHASMIERYEVWRAPAEVEEFGNSGHLRGPMLNNLFSLNPSQATVETPTGKGEGISPLASGEPAYEWLLAKARAVSPDAGTLAQQLIYYGNAHPRLSYEYHSVHRSAYSPVAGWWSKMEQRPIDRESQRIGNEWPFVNSWAAGDWAVRDPELVVIYGPPTPWTTTDYPWGCVHYLRGVRDAFYADFDAGLDVLAGKGRAPEYDDFPDGRCDIHVTPQNTAEFVRTLYLWPGWYIGPSTDRSASP